MMKLMTMEVKLISCWLLTTILVINSLIISTNGFNFKRSLSNHHMGSSSSPSSSFKNQDKSSSTSSSSSSSGNGHFGKSDKLIDDDTSNGWSSTGKQFNMDGNDDSPTHSGSDSRTNGRHQHGTEGDTVSDQEFQRARDWKGFVDDWERKAKDELADAINENMKIDSGKSDDDGQPKDQNDGRDHHDDDDHRHPQRHGKNHDEIDSHHQHHGKQIGSMRINKDDSGSNYGNQASNWDWDKEANGAWTRKSDDGQKHDFGKFEQFHQKFADHEHVNKGKELDEETGHNEHKSEDQRYGKKLGGWNKTKKSGDHHLQSGHNKHTSHSNKFDANDSWKGWDN